MKEMKVRVDIAKLADGGVLAGSIAGRRLLRDLLEQVTEPVEPEACFLDFSGVDVATASFLRDSVLEFRRAVRGRRSNIYPVIANAADEILDDLALVLRFRSDAMLACELSRSSRVSNVRIIGQLEVVQRETFEIVKSQGDVSTGILAKRRTSGVGVGITAWNNRLSSLVIKGLIIESSRGRAKSYKPVLPG